MAGNVISTARIVPGLLEQLGSGSGKASRPSDGESAGGFAQELGNMLKATNDSQLDSAALQEAFLNGEPVELHQVMIKAEEAGLTMDLLLEVRNKLVDAYKKLTEMPL